MEANSQRKSRRINVPISLLVAACVGLVWGASSAPAGASAKGDTSATHYYVSLGDSLAASFQPNGDYGHGYAEQLYAQLKTGDPKLELVKLGCGGESTISMRFGSQPPEDVLSCGGPRLYKWLYPKETQLAEAIGFLRAHKSKVALVTIDIGANDLSRLDAQGSTVSCLLEPQGCAAQKARIVGNLSAILSELQAADPGVQIVGMTYYDVFAPLWFTDPVTALLLDGRVAELNAALAATYRQFGIPVADVAGAFENGVFPDSALNVCAWTWFCSQSDIHANTAGYAVIARAFEAALP